MQIIPQNKFDRDLAIEDLLKGIDRTKLQQVLQALLGEAARVVDLHGMVMIGVADDKQEVVRIPLSIQLEPVAYLEASDPVATPKVARLLEMILKSAERYLMASELHLESVHADYEKLQKKHEALIASEEKYKELAKNLEMRVQAQVVTIEETHRQLYQAEKLASVGQLAAGVAHEINNPIGFIRSNLSTAQTYVADVVKFGERIKSESAHVGLSVIWNESDLDETLQDFTDLLEESVHGADRIARIVGDLKDFSNVDRSGEEMADLNQVIQSVCNVAASQIEQKAEVELLLQKLPVTRCQPGHLGQVFLNLLLNAAAAIKQHGKIQVDSELIDGEIVIRISDDGCGMSDEIINRIFEPFYTTRDVGSGTGLGLTVSRDVVQLHDGRLDVSSQEGKGSTFSIFLPVKE